MTDAFDHLLTTLQCDDRFSARSVIMVTSGAEKEGKTFVCTHLATSLARRGRKTLLIDADLRRPSCHRIFDLEAQPGLSEILRGEADLDLSILSGPLINLSILPAGQEHPAVTQALSNGILPKLIEDLRGAYDYVIVDSGPVLTVSDSVLIGKHVDAVLLVVRSKRSKFPLIHAAYRHLTGLNINVVGAVVNGVELKVNDPYYASSYSR